MKLAMQSLLKAAVVLSGLLVATCVDFDCFEIPDEVSIGGMVLAPIVSLVYSIRRMIMAASLEHGVSVSIAWGAYLIGLSALLGIVGSVRFGGALRAHGTAPSSPDSGVSPRG